MAIQLGVYDLRTGHRTAILDRRTGYNATCSLAPDPVRERLLVAIATARPPKQGVVVFTVRVFAVDVQRGHLPG